MPIAAVTLSVDSTSFVDTIIGLCKSQPRPSSATQQQKYNACCHASDLNIKPISLIPDFDWHEYCHHNFRFNHIPFYLDSKFNRESFWNVDKLSFYSHHNFDVNYSFSILEPNPDRESLWIVNKRSFDFRRHNFRPNDELWTAWLNNDYSAVDIWNPATLIGTEFKPNVPKPDLFYRISVKLCCYYTEHRNNDSRLQHIKFSVNKRSSVKLTDNGSSYRVDINTTGKL
ncbi:unnamed protein product, partial [Mesorhabditis spiculigera]